MKPIWIESPLIWTYNKLSKAWLDVKHVSNIYVLYI